MQTDTVAASTLLNLLGVTLDGVTGQLGLGCSPLSIVGAGGGNACSAQPVCCQNNNVVCSFVGILGAASVLTAVFLGRPALCWLRPGPALRLMTVLPNEEFDGIRHVSMGSHDQY